MSKATKTNMDGRSRRGPVVTTWKQWQKLTDTDHSSAWLGSCDRTELPEFFRIVLGFTLMNFQNTRIVI